MGTGITAANGPIVVQSASRPLDAAGLDRTILGNLRDTTTQLQRVTDALGDHPAEVLLTADATTLAQIDDAIGESLASLEVVSNTVRFAIAVRADVDLHQPKTRNAFQGNVHLDEIKLDVILTLDQKTGTVTKIDILPQGTNAPTLKKNQIRTTMSGSEFAKETLVLNWSSDLAALRAIDAQIERGLLVHGTVENEGTSMSITRITRGQIPSARAWVNPQGALRQKWEKSRAVLAARRLQQLNP